MSHPWLELFLASHSPPLEGEALTARVYLGNDIASVIGNDAPGNDGSSVRGIRLGMMLTGEFGYSP